MENLNKEKFWNEMKEKYPLAVKDFCNWIDDYKDRVAWNTSLFYNHRRIKKDGNIKFHDLPLAMQMGIWNEYLDAYDLLKCKDSIETILYGMEEGLNESTPSHP